MTIQFQCEHCGTVLKTSDDKAGKLARCPGCREIIDIPETGTRSSAGSTAAMSPRPKKPKTPSPDERDDHGDDYGEYGGEYGGEYSEEYADDYDDFDDRPRRRHSGGGASKRCPMCGERLSSRATRCKYCGESLTERGRGSRTSKKGLDATEAISTAWAILQTESGTCIGAVLLPLGLQLALNFVTQLGFAALAAILHQAIGEAAIFIFVGLAIVWIVGLALLGLYIQCGQTLVMVNVARDRSNGISDLFAGGPYMMTLLLNTFVLTLAFIPVGIVIVAMAALAEAFAVIGIILFYAMVILVLLAVWPMTFALVDQNLSGLEPLKTAFQLTDGYRLTSLLLFLLLGLINVGGAFACGIGLLVTIPLSMLTLAVAYCRLAGREVRV